LAWLTRHGGTGQRGEAATHFEWAHCDPLQVVAELGLLGVLWLAALLVALFRSRPRGDPLPLVAAAAFVPFSLLHYPLQIAVGLIPVALVLARWLATEPATTVVVRSAPARLTGVTAVAVAAVLVVAWQLAVLETDRWHGAATGLILAAQQQEGQIATSQLLALERQATQRIRRQPGQAPWLWRLVGRARLTRGAATGADRAFRRALAEWPHEEAEFGLGLALALRGQSNQAVHHLKRVARVNPDVALKIPDPDLRRGVMRYVDAVAAEAGQRSPYRRYRRRSRAADEAD
jgi:hypothetical protein